MNDDIAEGINIPNGTFVELLVGDGFVYMMDSESGEIYEVWRVH
jgi:hypothetical protein